MLTTVQLACIVMSKSGAPLANFGAQMSTGALLFSTLPLHPPECDSIIIIMIVLLHTQILDTASCITGGRYTVSISSKLFFS